MSQLVGLRVVRGPNWKWQTQDGGEGYVGTVVSINSSLNPTAVVRWDCGTQALYRMGPDSAYDLRILDNATSGVKHNNINCDGCNEEGIAGIRWKCMVCNNYDLCTSCYMNDRHDVDHRFRRIVEPGSNQVDMPPRSSSVKLDARGVFPSAIVVRGADWKWDAQDGGSGKTGKVIEILNWSEGSYRSAVSVLWNETGRRELYRLGHEGKVDVQGKTCGPGGKYYRDHLPNVGETHVKQPVSLGLSSSKPFASGDKVTTAVTLETLKKMQEDHGGWISEMNAIFGKVGVVVGYTERGNVQVEFESNKKYTFNPQAFSKIAKFAVDDKVKVIGDAAKAKLLQEGHGGWNERMIQVLGQIGKVTAVNRNGNLRVKFKDSDWLLNPQCCIKPSNADLDCAANAPTSSAPTVATDASEVLARALFSELSLTALQLQIGVMGLSRISQTASQFRANDVVTVISDANQAKRLQKGHGGWNDLMLLALGKTGRVVLVDSDGDVKVNVGVRTWIFNPDCLTIVRRAL